MGSHGEWGLHFENDFTELVLETPGWVESSTKLMLRKSKSMQWRLDYCDGRLCADLVPGQMLRSLRVTLSSDRDVAVQGVCSTASQLMTSIAPLVTKFVDGEHHFERAAKILRKNAALMGFNEGRQDDEYALERQVDWTELGDLLGQTHYDKEVDPSMLDDPFEELNPVEKDKYFIDRQTNGRRNKLALFLRRRQWSLVESISAGADQKGPELRFHGEVPSPSQVRYLANALMNPRKGAVFGAALALHDLAIDLLSGLEHKMLYQSESQLDNLAALSILAPDSSCGLSLVTFEFTQFSSWLL